MALIERSDNPLSHNFGRLARWLEPVHRRWVVILMLGALHLALAAGLGSVLGRALLVSHVGFFLLWQPVVRFDRKIGPLAVALILLVGLGLLTFKGQWLIVLWIAGLVGLSGGRVFSAQMPMMRRFYLLSVSYLLVVLLVWAVPTHWAGAPIPVAVGYAVEYGLVIVFIVMAIMPLERLSDEPGQTVDFFYALLLSLLAIVLALGTLAFKSGFDDYYLALTATIIVSGLALLVLAILWNPGAGYGGLQSVFSRYLLSVGLPFETWLQKLAEGSEREEDPDKFLSFAIEQLGQLPWVIGGEWQTTDATGKFGETSTNHAAFSSHDLRLRLFANLTLGPALVLHMRLLTQLLGEFYEAKRREQALRESTYLQAVHATGARLTHDIKNLLQSLYSLSAAGQGLPPDQLESYASLVQRQLPALTNRLQLTLERLRAPTEGSVGIQMDAAVWWEDLKRRYEGRDIQFAAVGATGQSIPRNVFDSVAENLLENARRKRIAEPGVRIDAILDGTNSARLTVTDTGSAVPTEVAAALFRKTVSTEQGMGIGLLQSAQQARQAGYRLRLANNKDGAVTFELYRE